VPGRRLIAALFVVASLWLPAVAVAQTATIPMDGANVSPQPPVQLSEGTAKASSELPNTGTDPRLLFLAGVALTLLGVGLRLRTVDADLY
jgi:LPXTG-motif cell wall-anchored protein